MANRPAVSAIVVSHNRAEDFALCLEAIRGWTGVAAEIIVVDNASTDAAPDVAARVPGVRLVRSTTNLGFAAANNLGVRLARGDFIALVNNDAVTARDWARRLVGFLESHRKAAAAGGRQFLWDGRHPVGDRSSPFLAHAIVRPDGMTPACVNVADQTREVATLSGAAVLIRRDAIDDVGAPFLDPLYFMYFEETDFFARALRRGWRLYYVEGVDCWHRSPATTGSGASRRRYLLRRNRLIFAYRHFDDAALESLLREERLRVRAAFWKGLLRRQPKYRARRAAWRWANANRQLLLRERAGHCGCGRDYLELVRGIQEKAAGAGTPVAPAPGRDAPRA